MSLVVKKFGSGSNGSSAGWANYINGNATPITIPAGVETKLTLDATTGTIIDDFIPNGSTSLWDSANSQFDFTGLKIGDIVNIRVDGSLTNTGINQSFLLSLVAAIGSPSEFSLPFSSGSRFIPSTSLISRYNGIFIGSDDVVNYPSELRVTSTDSSTALLVDIYINVISP